MRFIYATSIWALVVLVSACKNEKTSETDTTHTENSTTTDTSTLSTSASNGNEVKLNPAHGQPGHRCDIPVGQPLDSEPNNIKIEANSAGNQQSPVFNTNSNNGINIQQSTNNNSAKLNPAHGQPGHRCDIPVGQPLPEN